MITRRTALLAFGAAFAASPINAAPARYDLDRENSRINYTFVLNGNQIRGKAVVQSANIQLDIDRPSRSTVEATIDMTRATAGIFFATEATKGA